MGHTPLTRLPSWYAKLLLRLFIHGDHWVKIEKLIPANLIMHREVKRLKCTYGNYQEIIAEVLLMSGEKSPKSVHQMIDQLEQTSAKTQTMRFPKLNHFGPENDSAPVEVAQQVKKYFCNSTIS